MRRPRPSQGPPYAAQGEAAALAGEEERRAVAVVTYAQVGGDGILGDLAQGDQTFLVAFADYAEQGALHVVHVQVDHFARPQARVYQIQQRWQTKESFLFQACQLRLTGNKWHLYWMRKFDAWWPYPPPEHGRRFSLQARLQQRLGDEDGCFWGLGRTRSPAGCNPTAFLAY